MNYLPFARRVVFTLGSAPTTVSLTLPSMAAGGPGRAILQDFDVNTVNSSPSRGKPLALMRYGWEKRGFLTEAFHPIGAFMSKGRPLTGVWKFEKPYRIDPGEEIKATISAGGYYVIQSIPSESTPALAFNCVRVKDNQPRLLYDVSRTVDATGTIQSLSMACDSDSSLLLYSVSIHDWYDPHRTTRSSQLQIFGPGNREWFHLESTANLTAALWDLYRGFWLEGVGDCIDLGEKRGWVQEQDEAFVAEFVQTETDGSDITICATLRGVMERPYD